MEKDTLRCEKNKSWQVRKIQNIFAVTLKTNEFSLVFLHSIWTLITVCNTFPLFVQMVSFNGWYRKDIGIQIETYNWCFLKV